MAVRDVTSESFRQEVQDSEIPVVVDFYATWCPSCRQIAPQLEALSERWDGRVRFAKVDVERAPELARDYQVSAVPTVVLIESGAEKARSLGAKLAGDLEIDLELASIARNGEEIQDEDIHATCACG